MDYFGRARRGAPTGRDSVSGVRECSSSQESFEEALLALAACNTLASHRVEANQSFLPAVTAEYPQLLQLSWQLIDGFVRLEPVRTSSTAG